MNDSRNIRYFRSKKHDFIPFGAVVELDIQRCHFCMVWVWFNGMTHHMNPGLLRKAPVGEIAYRKMLEEKGQQRLEGMGVTHA